jgi:hypothetical protein
VNAKFAEFFKDEVRRIPIPRTSVHKGMKKDLSVRAPQKEGQRSHRGPLLLSSGSSYSMARFLLCCKPLSSVETFSSAVTP